MTRVADGRERPDEKVFRVDGGVRTHCGSSPGAGSRILRRSQHFGAERGRHSGRPQRRYELRGGPSHSGRAIA